MRFIPKQVKEELENDPRMKQCCLWYLDGCDGRIEWHHNLIYAGRQVNIPEAILPLCKAHHDIADHKEIKQRLDWVMFSLWNEAHFEMFPKSARILKIRQRYLKMRYGEGK